MEITGKVIIKKVSPGSKSGRDAVCINTGEETFVLKRMGGNPFNDDTLNKLVGKKITATGIREKYTFIMKSWEETER